MTESDNQPVFDPATDSDAPAEDTTPTEAPTEETTPTEVTPEAPTQPEQPTEEPTPDPEPTPAPDEAPDFEPTPVPDTPGVQDAVTDEAQSPEHYDDREVDAQPVSGVPTPGAVSDPKPEQTDNRERPEDGEQDVSQDATPVPSDDENPDTVA